MATENEKTPTVAGAAGAGSKEATAFPAAAGSALKQRTEEQKAAPPQPAAADRQGGPPGFCSSNAQQNRRRPRRAALRCLWVDDEQPPEASAPDQVRLLPRGCYNGEAGRSGYSTKQRRSTQGGGRVRQFYSS